jgi:hypothetical protein
MGNGFRPLRRNMAWDAGAHDAGIARLLDRLSFTTGRQRWGCALRFGLLRATPCDMEAIGEAMHAIRRRVTVPVHPPVRACTTGTHGHSS